MKKLKHENVHQVRTGCVSINSWLKLKKAKKDLCCSECKTEYSKIRESGVETFGLMIVMGHPNVHLCNDCGKRYINELGLRDISSEIEENKKVRDSLFEKIKELGIRLKDNQKDLKNEELQKMIDEKLQEIEVQNFYDSISFSEEELFVEDYLIKEYGVISNPRRLKHENQIEDYFKDCGSEYFDCGQGYYDDGKELIVKIGPKFFSVYLEAEIGSAKQDRGDRLYWVEDIESVKWEEIEKPKKKEDVVTLYKITMNRDDRDNFQALMRKNGTIFEIMSYTT